MCPGDELGDAGGATRQKKEGDVVWASVFGRSRRIAIEQSRERREFGCVAYDDGRLERRARGEKLTGQIPVVEGEVDVGKNDGDGVGRDRQLQQLRPSVRW